MMINFFKSQNVERHSEAYGPCLKLRGNNSEICIDVLNISF